MRGGSMVMRIFGCVLLTAALILAAGLTAAIGFTYEYYSNAAEAEVKHTAAYTVAGVDKYGVEFLQTVKDIDASGKIKLRFTYISPLGEVIFDTHADASQMENHLEREEVALALEHGEGESRRYSGSLSKESYYYAFRTESGHVLRVSTEVVTVLGVVGEIMLPATLIITVAVLIALVAAVMLSQSIVRPIEALDLENPVTDGICDEVRPIINKLTSQNRTINERVRELEERKNELDLIIANMSEGLCLLDSHAQVLSINNTARTVLGIEDSSPVRILSYASEESLRLSIFSALAGKSSEFATQRGEKHYTVSVTPVLREGFADGAVIIFIDDTEKEKREALRREFTSNVSHELKTPLTSISGFAELIKEGLAKGEDAAKFADKIYKEAGRLIGLVDDIIRLTRLDGGEIELDGEMNLYEIAGGVLDRLSSLAERASVSLSLDGEGTVVMGNGRVLTEMIYNLVDNAIKYNKTGGRVVVSVKNDGGKPTVTVTDNGIGIPRDKLDRVFERFYRVDKSHSKEIGGTGLGLSIVKRGALFHGAELSINSDEGRGCEVKIIFPEIKK